MDAPDSVILMIVMGTAPALALAVACVITAVVSGNVPVMLWGILLSLPATVVLFFGFPATLLSPILMVCLVIALRHGRRRLTTVLLIPWLLLWLWVLYGLATAPVTGA